VIWGVSVAFRRRIAGVHSALPDFDWNRIAPSRYGVVGYFSAVTLCDDRSLGDLLFPALAFFCRLRLSGM